jgi:Fe-S-cluster containining protein
MMLSGADIKLLEKVGYDRKKFMRFDKQGYARLRNQRGFCVFYSFEKHRCRVYKHRPLGCRVYPVIYSEEEGIILDDLCPMRNTISEAEMTRKGKRVMKLLQKIEKEALALKEIERTHPKQQ